MVSRKQVSKSHKKNEQEPKTGNLSNVRYYYEGGDIENFANFCSINAKATLHSFYLEYCKLNKVDLLDTLEGCHNLKIIKLVQVDVDHEDDFQVKEYREIHLPKLACLFVSDISSSVVSTISNDNPFVVDSDLENRQSSPAEELAAYHIDFYSQLLCYQLRGQKSLRLCSQLSNLKVDISISLAHYKIFLWYQSMKDCEKLVISPLIRSWNDNLLKNFVDAATVKYLSCNDNVLSLEATPYNLEELNLYISKKKGSLLTDLALSKKLSNLSTLILYFSNKCMIDLKLLALNLSKLDDLVITNAIIHSTANDPLKVSDCCFDQCSFSENLMTNVSKFLQCSNLAIDVNQIRNWDGLFKINLMKLSGMKRILSWSVNTSANNKEDQLVFLENSFRDSGGQWKTIPFDHDAKFRRSVLLHQNDFFQDHQDWDKNNLEKYKSNPSINRRTGSTFERRTMFWGKALGFVVCGISIFLFYLLSKK